MNVVIVELVAKAKTINKYLGSGYKVLASFGHVRDLPSKDGSVEPDKDFEMHWDVDGRSQKIMKEIADAVKGADKLILATDPDREGEAISWHILQILEQKKALKKGMPIERVTFNAVTKQSILDAMKSPARSTRRWCMPTSRAGRSTISSASRCRPCCGASCRAPARPAACSRWPCASCATARPRSRPSEATNTGPSRPCSRPAKGEEFPARLNAIAGKTLEKLDIKDGAAAHAIKAAIEKGEFRVVSVEKKAVKRNPFAPFTTSTLQKDASRKLGFSAKQTMQVAQRLYEGVDLGGETVGLITYMRTDGVTIIPEAIAAIRKMVEEDYSKRYLPPFIREYKTKAKNAQEAHEAIRPTDPCRASQPTSPAIWKDQAGLYELIWKRAVASQMASAEVEQTTADIEVKGRDGKTYSLRATGSVIQFDGFLKLYEEGRDERVKNGKDEEPEEDDSRRLPPLAQGDALKDRGIDAEQHFTQPPPRYSEATLVKRMEELGIGRPSTYASTLAVLQERDYVRIDKKRLIPEDKGRLVIAFLEGFFKRYVEYDFTADLEEKLDLISDGKLEWKDVLRDFWREFTGAVDEIKDLRVGEVLEALNEILGPHIFPPKAEGGDPRKCPSCGQGRLSLKIRQVRRLHRLRQLPRLPLHAPARRPQGGAPEASTPDGKLLGHDPETGLAVTLRTGRFGPYVQLGEAEGEEKPKRASVPKGVDANAIDLEYALKLLSLPREVGLHPETGKPITAGLGRYGPFVLHDGTYANLPSVEEVFTVGLNRAVALLAEKKAGGGKGRFQRAEPTVLKDLGEHPDGGKIQVLSGRYGPYVKHGNVNATLPRGKEPATLTMDEAVS